MNVALEAEGSATLNETLLAIKAMVRSHPDLSERMRDNLCSLFHNVYCLGFAQGVQKAALEELQGLLALREKL